jgi:MFS family permease
MYRFDWIEQLKLRAAPSPAGGLAATSPVILALGLTSFLTDISAEMVNSLLPVYLFLHLKLTPFQYGAIDGVYNGLSIALVGLAAGLLADRWTRQKEVALAGYGLSAGCKLLLVAAGGVWSSIAAVVAIDRLGKGIRTAPRDALISFHAAAANFGTAFGVHRAMDSAGALLGPIIAFVLLAQVESDFDSIWVVSFVIACLGVAALWLFVPKRAAVAAAARRQEPNAQRTALLEPRFVVLTACATLLALVTVSDAFLYLLVQEKAGTGGAYLPLFYVVTAAAYMALAVPVGRIADRFGRLPVLLCGYLVLAIVYAVLASATSVALPLQLACLALLGLYYAGTEGILLAIASAIAPAARRTTAIAVLVSCIGLGKLVSSVLFGWAWQTFGAATAIGAFLGGLLVASAVAGTALGGRRHE